MKRQHIGLYLSILILAGCTSIPEANEKNQTMFIGEISFEGSGFSDNLVSLNGMHKTGIEITIQNTMNQKTHILHSDSKGRFYSVNIPEGNYRISKLLFQSTSNASSWITNPRIATFTIRHGIVNNFGNLSWKREYRAGNISNDSFYHNPDDGLVRNNFEQRHPKSGWNEKRWFYLLGSGF